MVITIIKIISVIVILAAMFIILLDIGHLTTGSFNTDREDIDQLREDVENKRDVVSNKNTFHDLVAGNKLKIKKHTKRNAKQIAP